MDVEEITMTTQGPEKPASQREAETCDIVIVGGGPAGLAAAIGAKQTNANANVIVVEKLDILSGNGKFDMNFFDIINTEAQKKAGNEEWTVNQVENFIESKKDTGESAERIEVWANEENELDAWLRAMGVELNYNYVEPTTWQKTTSIRVKLSRPAWKSRLRNWASISAPARRAKN
ncbi:MAG: FAD-binding protein [Holdemania massiliensis]